MRRCEFWALAVATILVTLLQNSFALRCWSCNSEGGNEGFCNDPFDSSTVIRQNRRWSYVDCSVPPQIPYNSYGSYNSYNTNNNYNAYSPYSGSSRLRPVCQKAVHLIDGRTFVHRKCAWVTDFDPVDKCMFERTPSYLQRVFCEYCEEDGCNGAAQYGPITMLLGIPAAITLKFLLL